MRNHRKARRWAGLIALFIALVGCVGCARMPYHAENMSEPCVIVVPEADNPFAAGILRVVAGPHPDYDHGIWFDTEGRIFGYSAEDDSPIWNHGWCEGPVEI